MVVTNPEHRKHAEEIWKVPAGTIPEKPGYHAVHAEPDAQRRQAQCLLGAGQQQHAGRAQHERGGLARLSQPGKLHRRFRSLSHRHHFAPRISFCPRRCGSRRKAPTAMPNAAPISGTTGDCAGRCALRPLAADGILKMLHHRRGLGAGGAGGESRVQGQDLVRRALRQRARVKQTSRRPRSRRVMPITRSGGFRLLRAKRPVRGVRPFRPRPRLLPDRFRAGAARWRPGCCAPDCAGPGPALGAAAQAAGGAEAGAPARPCASASCRWAGPSSRATTGNRCWRTCSAPSVGRSPVLSVTSYEALEQAIQRDQVDMAFLSGKMALDAVTLRAHEGGGAGHAPRRPAGLSRAAADAQAGPPHHPQGTAGRARSAGAWRAARAGRCRASSCRSCSSSCPTTSRWRPASAARWWAPHQVTALAVANGEADVATNNTADFERFRLQFPAEAERLQVIWESELIPHAQIVVRRGYGPEFREEGAGLPGRLRARQGPARRHRARGAEVAARPRRLRARPTTARCCRPPSWPTSWRGRAP